MFESCDHLSYSLYEIIGGLSLVPTGNLPASCQSLLQLIPVLPVHQKLTREGKVKYLSNLSGGSLRIQTQFDISWLVYFPSVSV